jgi:ABC-type branched-subunit amino acid transport system substrate-binding protein
MASLANATYSTPQNKSGLEASIADINANGGVNGHPLKLDFCDTNYDANQELSCTRQLISDHVSVALDPSILADASGREFTAFAAAGIPVLGTQGLSPAELNSKVVFPLSSGIPGWVYGAVDNLVAHGDKKIVAFTDPNPGSQFFASVVVAAAKSAGLTATTVTADPSSDPTFSTGAAKAIAGGTTGIVLCPSPVNVPKMVLALKQAGYTGQISSITAIFAPPIVKAMGSAADGVLLTSQVAFSTETSDPGVVKFLADMKKYQPNSVIDESTLFTWASAQLFAKVMAKQTSFTPANVLKTLNAVKTPINIGVAAPWSVVGKKSPLTAYSRIFNPTVQNGVLKNGAIVAQGGFVNPFAALKAAA